jgi:hypothetical protein
MRTRDRIADLADFGAMTPARARALARTYALDFLVTPQSLDLPLVFSSGPLRVYALGGEAGR